MRQLGESAQGGAAALTSGTLGTPPARLKVDETCFGMLSGVQCETLQVPLSQNTQQWQVGDIVPCPLKNARESNRCQMIVVQSEETLTVPQNAVCHWQW